MSSVSTGIFLHKASISGLKGLKGTRVDLDDVNPFITEAASKHLGPVVRKPILIGSNPGLPVS